jgi:hypothetical protein
VLEGKKSRLELALPLANLKLYIERILPEKLRKIFFRTMPTTGEWKKPSKRRSISGRNVKGA